MPLTRKTALYVNLHPFRCWKPGLEHRSSSIVLRFFWQTLLDFPQQNEVCLVTEFLDTALLVTREHFSYCNYLNYLLF